MYDNDDKQFLGQSSPKVNWSMRNEFTFFKDLTFSFNIYSKMGHKSLETDYLNENVRNNLRKKAKIGTDKVRSF